MNVRGAHEGRGDDRVVVPLRRPGAEVPAQPVFDVAGLAGPDGLAGAGGPEPEHLDALAAGATALSRWLFTPPSDVTLAVVRDPEMLAQWPLTADPTAEGLRLLQASGQDAAESEHEIAADHARLFVGPGRLRAAPYESVHRSADRLLFGEQTLAVRDWFRAYGVSAPCQGREPDDHIGLELEFVAMLLEWALEAVEEGEDLEVESFTRAAAEFVEEHPGRWAGAFFELVAAEAHTDFYRGVARLGLGWLQEAATRLPGSSQT